MTGKTPSVLQINHVAVAGSYPEEDWQIDAINSVYFIAPVGGGPIKIGYAQNVQSRLWSLTMASPYPLEIVASAPGGIADERHLHRLFSIHRLHGEWFSPAAEIVDLVKIIQRSRELPLKFTAWYARPVIKSRMPADRSIKRLSAKQLILLDESRRQFLAEKKLTTVPDSGSP